MGRGRIGLVFGVWVFVLLVAMFGVVLSVSFVKGSGTIYIRVDGSVDPSTAPIKCEGCFYTFFDNIDDSIVVQMNDITIDGAGYTLSGTAAYDSKGIDLAARKNVTVRNMVIRSFYYGVHLRLSSDNKICGNKITNNEYGIWLETYSFSNIISKNSITANLGGGISLIDSISNTVFGNNITANGRSVSKDNTTTSWGEGIYLVYSTANEITRNNVTNNLGDGFVLVYSSLNTISENNAVANNEYAMAIHESQSNIISGNNIEANKNGIFLDESSSNLFHHNNFRNNTHHVYDWSWSPFSPPRINPSINIWDDDYPSGGNYWSDYNGTDLCSGPFQNVTGSDGIGDTAYSLDDDNKDRFPLIGPFNTFDAGTWDGTTYNADLVSNSTISGFTFNADETKISFNVTGLDGTIGFSRVTIPNDLLGGPYVILVDGAPPMILNQISNGTHTFLYFTYKHSTRPVQIVGTTVVPEFSLAIILPLLVALSILALILTRRKNPQGTQELTPENPLLI